MESMEIFICLLICWNHRAPKRVSIMMKKIAWLILLFALSLLLMPQASGLSVRSSAVSKEIESGETARYEIVVANTDPLSDYAVAADVRIVIEQQTGWYSISQTEFTLLPGESKEIILEVGSSVEPVPMDIETEVRFFVRRSNDPGDEYRCSTRSVFYTKVDMPAGSNERTESDVSLLLLSLAVSAGIGLSVIHLLRWKGKASSFSLPSLYLKRDKVPDHPARKAIVETLHRQGILSGCVIGKLTGISRGTLQYHLRILEKYRYIVRDDDGDYHARGAVPRISEYSSLRKRIGLLAEGSGLKQGEIARKLGIRRDLVSYHMRTRD